LGASVCCPYKQSSTQHIVVSMFENFEDLFVPHIEGLPQEDYVETMSALLDAGFLVGYSLLQESIVVGTVTSCGFTRLIPIDRGQAGGVFRRTVDLMATLDGIQEADDETLEIVPRDWKARPTTMRCAAFAAMVKAGIVFDSALRNRMGEPSRDEVNVVFLRAIHDKGLRVALGSRFSRWAEKNLKEGETLPEEVESTDCVWMRRANPGTTDVLYREDQGLDGAIRTSH